MIRVKDDEKPRAEAQAKLERLTCPACDRRRQRQRDYMRKRRAAKCIVVSSGTPADRGSADAYYGRPCRPHKIVDGLAVTELTDAELAEYLAAYEAEDDRKDWG